MLMKPAVDLFCPERFFTDLCHQLFQLCPVFIDLISVIDLFPSEFCNKESVCSMNARKQLQISKCSCLRSKFVRNILINAFKLKRMIIHKPHHIFFIFFFCNGTGTENQHASAVSHILQLYLGYSAGGLPVLPLSAQ